MKAKDHTPVYHQSLDRRSAGESSSIDSMREQARRTGTTYLAGRAEVDSVRPLHFQPRRSSCSFAAKDRKDRKDNEQK